MFSNTGLSCGARPAGPSTCRWRHWFMTDLEPLLTFILIGNRCIHWVIGAKSDPKPKGALRSSFGTSSVPPSRFSLHAKTLTHYAIRCIYSSSSPPPTRSSHPRGSPACARARSNTIRLSRGPRMAEVSESSRVRGAEKLRRVRCGLIWVSIRWISLGMWIFVCV